MPRQHGRTSLIEACTGGHADAAQLLLERQADVCAADKVSGDCQAQRQRASGIQVHTWFAILVQVANIWSTLWIHLEY